MERLKLNFRKVFVFGVLLSTVLAFSQCKKDGVVGPQDPENPITNEIPGILDSQAVNGGGTSGTMQVNVSGATSDGGFAVRIPMDSKLISDSNEKPTVSTVRVFENGKEIGPGHSSHDEIRAKGNGRFSHKSGFLFLSASDNSNPKTNGKKYTYTVNGQGAGGITPPTTTPDPITPDPGPTTPISGDEPIGYASVNGKTTGGKGGQTVTVKTFAELKTAVTSKSPLIIMVSGTITGTGMLQVESNKSILGLPGSRLNGASLLIYGKNNVIVRNMTISNVISYSNIIIKEGAHHVWIDHCELSSVRVSDWDYYDGLLDVGTGADYVTLSWNKLHDNHKAMLIGFSYTRPDDVNHLKVTVHHNYFYNISERTPDVRYGNVHVFNNYMQNAGYVGALMGATVRVENNYFKNSSLPIRTEISPVAGFISGLNTNIFEASGANKITTAASSWIPTYAYTSVLNKAADVPALVTKGAGATLTSF
ncbi:pectate lyase [Pedobacter gandavensis]|uniref:pectate lyase family protein n=1 Tax=Pedobacter gandavensis TaxID=2679963 RepID=UPI00292EA762|nr:pectate lyase [Pedobacter gandavensis]